jgi:tRNA threonylcarbamoyl adenosine modification protein (Sua5/YciO/YrdC/YwlC family)
MILQVDARNPDPDDIRQITACLLDGGVIVFPTDTLYSFGCDLHQTSAAERIARLKKIRLDKADFSIICNSLAHLSEYCKPVDTPTFKMMKSLLPGPFTFILDANRNIPKVFNERKKTIGLRVPDHAVALAIVNALGHPIVASSVHNEDEIIPYATDATEIHRTYGHQVDIVIDSGAGGLQPSTVVKCADGGFEILRQGKGEFPGNY